MKEFVKKLIKTFKCEELRTELIAVSDVINIVNKLAEEYSVTGGWIPCSRELPPQPKENPAFDNKALGLYLVSDGYSDYPFRAFWNGKFFVDGFSKVEVVAWMPLPAPYQLKGE